jgi:hypothetical protein
MLPIQEKLICEASRTFDQTVQAAMNATGQLAQADTLTEKINESLAALGHTMRVEYLATVHTHKQVPTISTWLYVTEGHAQVRLALAHAGLEIEVEKAERRHDGDLWVELFLADFPDFTITLKHKHSELAVAA